MGVCAVGSGRQGSPRPTPVLGLRWPGGWLRGSAGTPRDGGPAGLSGCSLSHVSKGSMLPTAPARPAATVSVGWTEERPAPGPCVPAPRASGTQRGGHTSSPLNLQFTAMSFQDCRACPPSSPRGNWGVEETRTELVLEKEAVGQGTGQGDRAGKVGSG